MKIRTFFIMSILSLLILCIANPITANASGVPVASKTTASTAKTTTTTTTTTPVPQPDNSVGILEGIRNLLSNVVNLPANIANTIIKAIATPIIDEFKLKTNATLSVIGDDLLVFKQMLTNDKIHPFATLIFNATKPIGLGLLTLFFIIDFTKKSIYFEIMNWLETVKLLLKLIIAKGIFDQALDILQLILNIINTINAKILDVASGNYAAMQNYINTLNAENSPNIVQILMSTIQGLVFVTLMGLLMSLIFVVLNIRTMELAVLSGLAPLFFATAAGDATNDVFKSYIKNFITVAAQTIWMSVGMVFLTSNYTETLQAQGTASSVGGIFTCFIGIITLVIYIFKAPSSVRNAIGGTGGTSVNLASIAMILK